MSVNYLAKKLLEAFGAKPQQRSRRAHRRAVGTCAYQLKDIMEIDCSAHRIA